MDYKEKLRLAKEALDSGSYDKETIEYIFPELKESDDERIRIWIRKELESKYVVDNIVNNVMADKALAWLEKQGEHAKFRDSIQVGDEVTRNQDGMLVNLSQLNRVAKKDEKQGDDKVEQKPWSEEDEIIVDVLYAYTEKANQNGCPNDAKRIETAINKLKSLRPQSTWKPSIAQLNALSIVSKGNSPDDIEAIVSLYNDLKKLREE